MERLKKYLEKPSPYGPNQYYSNAMVRPKARAVPELLHPGIFHSEIVSRCHAAVAVHDPHHRGMPAVIRSLTIQRGFLVMQYLIPTRYILRSECPSVHFESKLSSKSTESFPTTSQYPNLALMPKFLRNPLQSFQKSLSIRDSSKTLRTFPVGSYYKLRFGVCV